jgi:hypothetical protein
MIAHCALITLCALVSFVHAGTFVLKDAPIVSQQMSMRFGVYGPEDAPYAQPDNNVTYVSIKRTSFTFRSISTCSEPR